MKRLKTFVFPGASDIECILQLSELLRQLFGTDRRRGIGWDGKLQDFLTCCFGVRRAAVTERGFRIVSQGDFRTRRDAGEIIRISARSSAREKESVENDGFGQEAVGCSDFSKLHTNWTDANM
jgi:hypothetical protein